MLSALQPAPPKPAAPRATAQPQDPEARRRRALRCAACGRAIADADDRTEAQGSHEHIFVNPHGFDFRIRLYNQAPGACPIGPTTAFYSWFPGHAWRVLVCAGCRAHLGWSYGEPLVFVGLIVDRLVEDD